MGSCAKSLTVFKLRRGAGQWSCTVSLRFGAQDVND